MKNYPLLKSPEGSIKLLHHSHSDCPSCSECEGKMTHILSIDGSLSSLAKTEGRNLEIYQCCNNPGMCDDWDPASGANACLLSSETSLNSKTEDYITCDNTKLIESFEDFCETMESNDSCVGVTGNEPIWMQDDETPNCSCNKKMTFVGQIEEAASDDFNFGGDGCAYIFDCVSCKKAKFLWQC